MRQGRETWKSAQHSPEQPPTTGGQEINQDLLNDMPQTGWKEKEAETRGARRLLIQQYG
ncbi:MAG: hypothetical protein RJB62_1789 [Pseudomonadota bacterium]|jgi:hypothetical protein